VTQSSDVQDAALKQNINQIYIDIQKRITNNQQH
ncbi:unnamed protein product, partial [Rotaria magnacalcarata]